MLLASSQDGERDLAPGGGSVVFSGFGGVDIKARDWVDTVRYGIMGWEGKGR